jgi:hypothetical protein
MGQQTFAEMTKEESDALGVKMRTNQGPLSLA